MLSRAHRKRFSSGWAARCSPILETSAIPIRWNSEIAKLFEQEDIAGMPVIPDEALRAWGQLHSDPRSFQIEAEPIDHEPRFVESFRGLKLRLLTALEE